MEGITTDVTTTGAGHNRQACQHATSPPFAYLLGNGERQVRRQSKAVSSLDDHGVRLRHRVVEEIGLCVEEELGGPGAASVDVVFCVDRVTNVGNDPHLYSNSSSTRTLLRVMLH